MNKGEKVYIVFDSLIVERMEPLRGDFGIAVAFGQHVYPSLVHVTDERGGFWEIPRSAVCTVPEGHLTDLYEAPCPACGLQLLNVPPQYSAPIEGDGVIRPYRPNAANPTREP